MTDVTFSTERYAGEADANKIFHYIYFNDDPEWKVLAVYDVQQDAYTFTGEMPENVRLGKSFRVQIELGQPEQALVVPRGNFYQQTGGQWIYKVNADKTRAVKVPVTIGRQNPRQYEITEGLQPGDLVIVSGYDTFGDAEELVF